MRRIVVVGAGGHAVSVTETIEARQFKVAAYVDELAEESGTFLGAKLLTTIPSTISGEDFFVIAIGDNFRREQATNRLLTSVPEAELPPLVHPSAAVAKSAHLGPGAIVLQGAIVGSGASIGQGCVINSGAIVEHECELLNFASVGPGAVIGGRSTVGTRSAVSIGAVVKHGISIGSDTVIGATSYVHNDLPALTMAFGVPATVRKSRSPSDSYLT